MSEALSLMPEDSERISLCQSDSAMGEDSETMVGLEMSEQGEAEETHVEQQSTPAPVDMQSPKVVLPPLKVLPLVDFKRAVSSPARTATEEEAALAAIRAIDALPKLPARQRTDTGHPTARRTSCRLSPLNETLKEIVLEGDLEDISPALGKCGRKFAGDPVCSLPPLPHEAKKALPQLPPLKIKSLPTPDMTLPPLSQEERKALPQLPPLQIKSFLKMPESPSSLEADAVVPQMDPLPSGLKKVDQSDNLSNSREELDESNPDDEVAAQSPNAGRQTVPWLTEKSQQDNMKSSMKDRSAPAASGSIRRPRSCGELKDRSAPAASGSTRRLAPSGDLLADESCDLWGATPADDRSEAPTLPKRLPSAENETKSYRKTKAKKPAVVASDPLALARERFQKEPQTPGGLQKEAGCTATPGTAMSKRSRRSRGPFSLDKRQQPGSVRDLQASLAGDLDDNMPPLSPRRRSTGGDQPKDTELETRKSAFARRAYGSRTNLSLSPSRHTLGSSHEKRGVRKVRSCDGDDRIKRPTTRNGADPSNFYFPGADEDLKASRHDDLKVSKHTRASTRAAFKARKEQQKASEHSKALTFGKSSWSPTSSISLESPSFHLDEEGPEDEEVSQLEYEEDFEELDGGDKRPPVEYVRFKPEVQEPMSKASGHSSRHSAHKPGMHPGFVEGGSGTRTSTEQETSVAWAYDTSTGTYKLIPMATNGGMPWLCLCGQENEAEFSFCGMCAQPQKWTCPHCQFSKNKCRFPHCGGCGQRRAGGVQPQAPRPNLLAPVDPIY